MKKNGCQTDIFSSYVIGFGTELPNIGKDYTSYVNDSLRPPKDFSFKAVDLFAGCGGLSLGFEAAGILTIGYEYEANCVDTYNSNLQGNCYKTFLTQDSILEEADIIIGGPPCQPFSVIGKQKGHLDERNGFPAFLNAVDRYRPRLWMFENVKGVYYKNKAYIEGVLSKLISMGYFIDYKILNAVMYGVPQMRERFIAVGHRNEFKFPQPSSCTVTCSAAIGDTSSDYDDNSIFLTPNQDRYIASYEKKSYCINPRDLRMDQPARTLTCRNLSAATSDMIRVKLPDGRRRRLSIGEAKRLQSFPDWFELKGNDTSKFNQIGNAVPPILAQQIAHEIIKTLKKPDKPVEFIQEITKDVKVQL